MSRLKFLPPERKGPPEGRPPAGAESDEEQALAEIRRRSRASMKDVVWVAVVLAAIFVARTIYDTGHAKDRAAAERAAELRAATAAALPPPGYDPRSRYPTPEAIEADAAVRQARALVTANAAATAADPMLNPKVGDEAALLAPPPSPKPFSTPGYGALPNAAAAPVAPPPAAVPAPVPASSKPPR